MCYIELTNSDSLNKLYANIFIEFSKIYFKTSSNYINCFWSEINLEDIYEIQLHRDNIITIYIILYRGKNIKVLLTKGKQAWSI